MLPVLIVYSGLYERFAAPHECAKNWHEQERAMGCYLNGRPTFASRIPFEEMREGSARPYLFGEAQRPACVQCHNDTLWAHMCLYQSHGPVCPRADQARLTREFVGRCAASLVPKPCFRVP